MSQISKISVITPVLNQAHFLQYSLDSVAQQAGNFDLEHIIIDGASTDGCLDLICLYAQKYQNKVVYISEPDKGIYDAVNKGFARSSGDIMAWLNADDIYVPGALEKVRIFFQNHPHISWLYGKCRIINEKCKEVRRWITMYKNRMGSRYSFSKLLSANFICQPSVFFRRSAWEAVKSLTLDYPLAADYEYWLRLSKISKPGFIPEVLSNFRWHPTSLGGANFIQQFNEELSIARKYGKKHRYCLWLHWINKWKIISIYTIMLKFHTLRKKLGEFLRNA